MNKLKIFVVITALLLSAVALFARRSGFVDTYVVYAESSSGPTAYYPFSTSLTPGMSLTRVGMSTQIGVTNIFGGVDFLWYYDVTHPNSASQKPIYANF